MLSDMHPDSGFLMLGLTGSVPCCAIPLEPVAPIVEFALGFGQVATGTQIRYHVS